MATCMERSFPAATCLSYVQATTMNNGSGPLQISWKCVNCISNSTYKGNFPSHRSDYIKTRSLSSIICSQVWQKWQIEIFVMPANCHMATSLVYSWYDFCNKIFKTQNITGWACLTLAICETFNKVSAEPYVYNCECIIDAVHPLPVSHLHVQHKASISMWNLPSITQGVANHTLI